MGLNAHFWIHQFRTDFVPAIERVVDVFLNRVLPTFVSIETEAKKRSEEAYEELCSRPGDGSTDLADLAETAQDVGIDYYISMKGLEQGMLNTCAVFLHHLFEQQLMLFHRRELLQPHEEKNSKLFRHNELTARLSTHGIETKSFSSWPQIEELRLLSNTIKHGEGKSSQSLFRLAPELFESPNAKLLGPDLSRWLTPATIYTPLLGDEIFVSVERLRSYEQALKSFWKDFGDTLLGI